MICRLLNIGSVISLLCALTILRCTAAVPPPADAKSEQALQELDRLGKNLKEFSGKVRLTETDFGMGSDPVVHDGRIYFQKNRDGTSRVHVVFDQRIVGDRKSNADKTEYLLDGQSMIDRNYRSRKEITRVFGQKQNLFKLGEGPFPLPIGQEPAEVHRLFDVQSIGPAKDDPGNAVHLRLIPKPNTDLVKRFYSIDVWVNETTHMPMRVDTEDAKGQIRQSTEFRDVILNPPGGLTKADFQLPDIDNNWTRLREDD